MNLEQVAANSFLKELAKIAECSQVDGEKTAAAGLLEKMDPENVVEFLKQAGFMDMLGGIGRGVGGLTAGAAKGLGSMAAGAARGVGGAISNTAGRAMGALKAAPGALGNKMTALGQRAEAGLGGMGQRLQAAGQAKGQAIQGRLAGPPHPPGQLTLPFNKPAPAAPKGQLSLFDKGQTAPTPAQEPVSKPPMSSMGEQFNPMHGMLGSLASSARDAMGNIGNALMSRGGPRGQLQQAPQQAAQRAPAYGTVAPAM